MAFCSNCGTKLDEGVAFCTSCGAKLETNGDETKNANSLSSENLKETKTLPKRKTGIIVGIIMAVVVVCGICQVVLTNSKSPWDEYYRVFNFDKLGFDYKSEQNFKGFYCYKLRAKDFQHFWNPGPDSLIYKGKKLTADAPNRGKISENTGLSDTLKTIMRQYDVLVSVPLSLQDGGGDIYMLIVVNRNTDEYIITLMGS